MWRRIQADGREWEVRATAEESARAGDDLPGGAEVLEFRCVAGDRRPRRVVMPSGALDRMSDDDLQAAYRRALPIAGDHYGRPGNHMKDLGA